jgi:phospholipase C
MLGGDTFGIHDDDAYYCKAGLKDPFCPKSGRPDYGDHTVSAPSLADQLESHGLTWKAYMESIPSPGSDAARWPTRDKPVKGVPPELYAAKHNGFMSFKKVQNDPQRARKIVGFDELERDLASGRLPNYAHIVPNQCNDMHGREKGPDTPEDCTKANGGGLIIRGDRVTGGLVGEIMRSALWTAPGNAAIVITFDENGKVERDDSTQGCCGYDPGSPANFGGGRIPTIVITNHGVRGLQDATPYNHYSLLRTTETAFGIAEHLANAGNTGAGVRDMVPLFRVP